MKYSLSISNFLEEISSLSHSIVFLYFFALITEEGFHISLCPLELCLKWNRSKMVEEPTSLDLEPQYTLTVTYQQAKCHSFRHRDSSKANYKDQKVGSSSIPGNICPFPKIVRILLPLISVWNYPAHKNNHTIFWGHSSLLRWCILSVECVSI